MHPWRPWILSAALAAMAAQAAAVYKWTDANGVVHYSDQPAPGAEKIFTGTNSSAGGAAAGSPAAAPTPQKPAAHSLDFTQFAITSPAPEQSFFGDEVIGVHLTLDPPLKPTQTVTWHLNGKQLDDQDPATTQFNLQSLERGTYVIAATVTDQDSGESRSTDSVTFFVRQPSVFSPQHRKP